MELLDIFSDGKNFSDGKEYGKQFWRLYEAAFPASEKKPQKMLERLAKEGREELLAVTENGEFIGLAINMLAGETALLDYFAISEEKRSGGFGGRAIRMLTERFAGKKYILEIEMQDDTADNAQDRLRRKKFYLRNGLKETGVFVRAYHVDFELLTPDGELDFGQYLEILTEVMGKELSYIDPQLLKD